MILLWNEAASHKQKHLLRDHKEPNDMTAILKSLRTETSTIPIGTTTNLYHRNKQMDALKMIIRNKAKGIFPYQG